MARTKSPSTRKNARQRQPARKKRPVPRLPRREWALPAGYHANGSGAATLRDVVSPAVPTIDGGNLEPDARVALTLLRIEAQPDLQLVTSGEVIDKARALDEVRRGTPLGRILVDVEQRAIEYLKETAETQRRARAKRQRERSRTARGQRPKPKPKPKPKNKNKTKTRQ